MYHKYICDHNSENMYNVASIYRRKHFKIDAFWIELVWILDASFIWLQPCRDGWQG